MAFSPEPTDLVVGEWQVLGALGIAGDEMNPTFSYMFRGPQTAGTLKSLPINSDCFLRFVFSNQVVSVSVGVAQTFPTANAFTPNIVALVPAISAGQWFGKHPIKAGTTVYIDSPGGIGSSEWLILVFEVDSLPLTT